MSRRPARFTEADVRRALRAAGETRDVVIELGGNTKIRLTPIRPQEAGSVPVEGGEDIVL